MRRGHKEIIIKVLSFILVFLALFINKSGFSQSIDSTSFKLFTRYSFYSYEKDGEFLLHIPPGLQNTQLSLTIKSSEDSITSWIGRSGKKILRIPFTINMNPSQNIVTAVIIATWNPGAKYSAKTTLSILPYKPNEVKTDRLTGGLIVNKRPFFPFGFYCYSPVHPTLTEEEVVKGFNMISPYQKIVPETMSERKAYMDRCAEIGMKVHYNIQSVTGAGGGGVGSKDESLTPEEKRKLLIAEIKTFMDHPALLAWYISDEPNAFRIPPEVLEEVYRCVKETDPWHPVSMVFTTPFSTSKRYAAALDVVMADPYPIPTYPVTMVNNVSRQLRADFNGSNPLWMVLQTFGGGEWWEREPTLQEIRSMTWQSVINGATGIQYFVRQGLNYFPKSAAAWGECGRMALEIAELTPWLLSDETPLAVESNSQRIIVTSRLYKGKLAVMAVNMTNVPVASAIRIQGLNNARARVIFENRSLPVSGGVIYDHLSPFGSQVYMIDLKPAAQVRMSGGQNLIRDPGFEDISSPGIPSACYARPGGDRGATYFTDTREYFDGNRSLRLFTPSDNKSVSIRFFPCQVKAGSSYMISIWAKSDPEQRFNAATLRQDDRLSEKESMPQYAEIQFGDFGRARFAPTERWRRFVTFITIPSDTTATFKTNLILRMPGQGVGWFDQVKVVEE